MARDVVLEKIKREIEKGVIDECQVVFVLSRIRKFLEDTALLEDYGYLNFYCNWALHSKIDRTKRLKKVLDDIKCLRKKDDGSLFFKEFGTELHRFCNHTDIECKWVTSKTDWDKVTNILSEIYRDVPLIYRYENDPKSKHPSKPKPKKLYIEEEIELKGSGSGLKVCVGPLKAVLR